MINNFYTTNIMTDNQPYPFQKYIDEQKHLDTDETRHLINPIIHIINEDFKGQEHLYCDKSQLDENGNFRQPELVIQAEQRGFKNFTEMLEADKKAAEEFTTKQNDAIQKLIDKQNTVDLKQQQIDSLQEQVKWLKETLAKLNPSP